MSENEILFPWLDNRREICKVLLRRGRGEEGKIKRRTSPACVSSCIIAKLMACVCFYFMPKGRVGAGDSLCLPLK